MKKNDFRPIEMLCTPQFYILCFMYACGAGAMYDKRQTFDIAYYGASGLLILAAIMVFFVKAPHHTIKEVARA